MASARPASVYDLEVGVVYVVTKEFTDHYGGKFAEGKKLTFERRDFLPYHGGHTITFREQTLYLQEEENANILNGLDDYLAVHDTSGRKPPPIKIETPKPSASGLLSFIGSLFFVAAFVAIALCEKRVSFMTKAGLLFFGIVAGVNGTTWWQSRRK